MSSIFLKFLFVIRVNLGLSYKGSLYGEGQGVPGHRHGGRGGDENVLLDSKFNGKL